MDTVELLKKLTSAVGVSGAEEEDRKSTRLNSSHP